MVVRLYQVTKFTKFTKNFFFVTKSTKFIENAIFFITNLYKYVGEQVNICQMNLLTDNGMVSLIFLGVSLYPAKCLLNYIRY